MNQLYRILAVVIMVAGSASCNGKPPTSMPTSDESGFASATPPPLPTFPSPTEGTYQSPEPAGFPYAAQLNDTLPKENLLLAIHLYADTVGHIKGDEACYDVGIYSDNSYMVISCLPDFIYPSPTGTLNDYQAKFLHHWVDTFQGFEDPSIHGLVKFAGVGNVTPSISDKVSMQALIGDIEWTAHGYVHLGGYPSAVFSARTVLSTQLNQWLDDSSILKFEVIQYPDSCLGAPKPAETCEPIITEGFRIFLIANNLMYEFHTDAFGYDIRQFGEPQVAPTQGAGG